MQILHFISVVSVLAALTSFVVIAIDLRNHPQPMKIMRIVWLLTALWAGILGLWAYFVFGRGKAKSTTTTPALDMNRSQAMPSMKMPKMDMPMGSSRPKWQSIALSTLHCGAGCALADLTGEWITAAIPISIAGSVIAGSWVLDYVLALVFGVMFQYFAIVSMRTISVGQAVKRAVKADFLSLTAWQVGMYGWMAIVYFGFFTAAPLGKDSWMFWFMMQIAMVFGFMFAYPVNALLIRLGIKQPM